MSARQRTFKLTILHESSSVCRLAAGEDVPGWAVDGAFVSITRTPDELSIICPSAAVPAELRRSDGWRALKVEGQFDFSEHGVLASIVAPLSDAGIPILAICTFNTDYVLVREGYLDSAVATLVGAGHEVDRGT
jgi:hypothetical protein